MNAETGAGYDMIVTTGLIMQTKTPNELMGVLAHETGHMAGGHVARSGDMEHAARSARWCWASASASWPPWPGRRTRRRG